ncbi:MAG: DUF1214 domain-containing protein [Methyloprofundus sp.]|nr:DUF1214 domain-containing protein [Methyloprofundus sp.]
MIKLIKNTFFIQKRIVPAPALSALYTDTSYPTAYQDIEGNYLSGNYSYRMTLPANVPVTNFWFIALYDEKINSIMKRDQPISSIGSLNELKYNKDGSVDLYFGPELPVGAPESNYLTTVSYESWSAQLRLFSPTQHFYDQTWQPGNVEKIKHTVLGVS